MYNFYYQICTFPVDNTTDKYLVRKFVIDKNIKKIIYNEDYIYNNKNINKLNKILNGNNYKFDLYDLSTLDNIPYPQVS